MLECKICHNEYKHLGSHIFHKHKIKANKYKEIFELPHNLALITLEIKEKKQKHFNQYREKYLKNILKYGKDYHYKKGRTQIKGYISADSKRKVLERIIKINKERKKEKCIICNMVFNNLDSHLYNKHKMIKVKKFERGFKINAI